MVNETWVRLANQLIPRAENKNLPTIPNGDTQDIINEVLNVYRLCKNDLDQFATVLRGNTIEETCSNIWHFIKWNIRYKEDPSGVQWIKTPARIWKDKVCDCKGYSIFTACILHSLGIKAYFRFVSYEKYDKNATHVYVVVKNKGLVVIDCVMPSFNYEKPYTHKKDYAMTQISRLSGIGCTNDCGCGSKIKPPYVQLQATPSPAPISQTEMALSSAIYNPDLAMTPDSLTENLLLLERLKIEMDIESKQDNWNDIRLAMYQEAIARVKTRIDILENYDAKIGFIKKLVRKGRKKEVDAAFASNPELGFIFLYSFIPNGEVYKNTNTRNLMAQMPAAVQQKAKLQHELFNYLESKSSYGQENFGKLIRNSITQVLRRSPEQFLSEILGIQLIEGEKWWYGSSFRVGNATWNRLFTAAESAAKAVQPAPGTKFVNTVSNAASLIPGAGNLISTGINLIKSIFKKKGVIESAFGINIPGHLDPSKVGPDLENDFGLTSGGFTDTTVIPPVKPENTLVNQILNAAQTGLDIVKERQQSQLFQQQQFVDDTNRLPPPPTEGNRNLMPIVLGGAALAAILLLKK